MQVGQLEVNGQIEFNGDGILKPLNTDSTTALQVQDTSGGTILDIDTSNGRVGVGTTPNSTLHLQESGTHTKINIENNTSGVFPLLQLSDTATGHDWHIENGREASGVLGFYNDTTAFAIDHNGNVGIGATAPSEALHLKTGDPTKVLVDAKDGGQHAISGLTFETINDWDNTAKADFILNGGGGTGLGMRFQYNGTDIIQYDGSGNIGLGTTDSTYPVTLDSTSGDKLAVYYDSSSADSFYGFGMDSSEMYIKSGDTKVISFLKSGNVGIGTNAPGKKLDVTGTVRAESFDVSDASQNSKFEVDYNPDTESLDFNYIG